MILKIIGHPYEFDLKNICAVFFPFEKIRTDGSGDEENIVVITEKAGDALTVCARVYEKKLKKTHIVSQDEDVALAMSVLLYNTLSEITDIKSAWGVLYGVRPAKLMHRFCSEMTESQAKDYFVNKFLVSADKADLTLRVMHNENRIISLSGDDSFSLYVSIPFCPTRCAYCSFVSHSVEKTQKLIEPFVELLCRELEEIGSISRSLSLRLETVYFGGGTPTTLSAGDLNRIFKTIEKSFDLSTLREYTVEAGRPDTINKSKLEALKNAGVSRISINPQTFNDKVLETIGRKHTAAQTLSAFDLAVKQGFDNINMDLIAGLPTDTLDSFKNSVDTAVSLGAQSVTVHSLALKTAAYLVTRERTFDLSDRLTATKMINYSNRVLSGSSYIPYYMYKQSKSAANLENVGWSKPGKECLYNVFMMDETHSVLAAGAGAVTRLKNSKTGKIERIYNYKYPYEYINNFDTVLARKKGITRFYEEYK